MPIKENPNIPLDNKQFRIYENSGKFIRVSVDETIARGLNSWKGWKCSAGIRGLYIDFDHNLWIANCASTQLERFNRPKWKEKLKKFHFDNGDESPQLFKKYEEDLKKEFFMSGEAFKNSLDKSFIGKQWGFLGNILEEIHLPAEYVDCPFDNCGCGADIILSKFKNNSDLLQVTNGGLEESATSNKDYVTILSTIPAAVEMNFPIPYQILWDMSRRCNYDCTYCWPSVHNNREGFLNIKQIIKVIDILIDEWADNNEIRWNFGGGEPTMHPKFLDIIKHLKSRNQWILVTTNGSRSTKFWKQAIHYINTVNMSAHFESMDKFPGNENRFIENCKIIMEHFDNVDDDFWLEIKLMTPPGMLDRALNFKERILKLNMLNHNGANGRMKGVMSLVPIRDLKNSNQLVKYSSNEIDFFRNQ